MSKSEADRSSAAVEEERRRKQEIIHALRQEYRSLRDRWGGYSGYDRWFEGPLNNAQLNTISTYNKWVPAFQCLLQKNEGNLEKFYEDCRQLTRLSKKERHERMRELLGMAQARGIL